LTVDPRFFAHSGPESLTAVAAAAGASPTDTAPRMFSGIASLAAAEADSISFCESRRHREALRATRAGAVLLPAALLLDLPATAIGLVTPQPALGFAAVGRLFHPPAAPHPGHHLTAVIAPDAAIAEGCEIGAYVVIGAGAVLGASCVLHPHAVVGPGVMLGAGCVLHPHSSISHAIAGDRVVLHPGARVGQEGFGLVPTATGFETMPQLGRVLLGEGVEVGANACIDRGALGDTVIGPGTRIDNLVQVGHGVATGRGCVLVSQAGIAGSTSLGDRVVIAAQAGLLGHLRVGDGARVGAQAGVIEDVPAKQDVIGSPAWPSRETWRAVSRLRELARGKAG